MHSEVAGFESARLMFKLHACVPRRRRLSPRPPRSGRSALPNLRKEDDDNDGNEEDDGEEKQQDPSNPAPDPSPVS